MIYHDKYTVRKSDFNIGLLLIKFPHDFFMNFCDGSKSTITLETELHHYNKSKNV